MTDNPSYFDWLTLIGLMLGPLIGIWVTRLIDRSNDIQRRKEAVLEGLIRTRGLELSPDHVSNLNMVPLLFNEREVQAAYSKIMVAVNDGALESNDLAVQNGAIARLSAARQDLIREIARAVKTPLPDGEMERLGYAPKAWTREFQEVSQLRGGLIDVIEGRRPLSMVAGVWSMEEPPNQSADLQEADLPPHDMLPAAAIGATDGKEEAV